MIGIVVVSHSAMLADGLNAPAKGASGSTAAMFKLLPASRVYRNDNRVLNRTRFAGGLISRGDEVCLSNTTNEIVPVVDIRTADSEPGQQQHE